MKRLVRGAKKLKKHISKHTKTLAHHAKDHFIPHEGNGHQPHVLKHHVLFGYTAIVILLKVLVVMVWAAYPKIDLQAMAITPENIVILTNQARTTAGLTALNPDPKLFASAQAKATDMLKNQYFAHISPNGVNPWHWIKNSGYKYSRSAENLAVHYSTAEGVEGGWFASPDHKKQILDPSYIDTGVGIAQGKFEGVDTVFVVQHFGIPAGTSIKTATKTTASPVLTVSEANDNAGRVKASGDEPDALQKVFGQDPQAEQEKLFGLFTAEEVENITHAFYALLVVFLIAAILLNFLVKAKVKKIKPVAHALSVICLIAILFYM